MPLLVISGIFRLVAFVAFHHTATTEAPNSTPDTRYALPVTRYPLRVTRYALPCSRHRLQVLSIFQNGVARQDATEMAERVHQAVAS
jgi:hypothetical protein